VIGSWREIIGHFTRVSRAMASTPGRPPRPEPTPQPQST
jgi:hypothetical protein